MTQLLVNPIFWIFGGGTIIALVAILSDKIVEAMKLRAKEREKLAARALTGEEALFSLGAAEDIRALNTRIDGLERRLDRLVDALEKGRDVETARSRRLDGVETEEPPVVRQT